MKSTPRLHHNSKNTLHHQVHVLLCWALNRRLPDNLRSSVDHLRSSVDHLRRNFNFGRRLELRRRTLWRKYPNACRAADVNQQFRRDNVTMNTTDVAGTDKYFMGNGMGTWFLSPLNLIADLFAYRNKGQYSLADLPEAHRDEIEACVCALLDRRRRLAQCSNQREFLHTVSLTKSPIRVLRCFRLISPFLSQSCTSNAMLVLLGLPACSKRLVWSGRATVHNKQEWPDWYPPAEMLARKPELKEHMVQWQSGLGMPGGPENPLGARAMYLWQGKKDALYRIHGTNEPWTIGTTVSSGCIRLTRRRHRPL
jgi:hypothetical protein